MIFIISRRFLGGFTIFMHITSQPIINSIHNNLNIHCLMCHGFENEKKKKNEFRKGAKFQLNKLFILF